MMRRDLLAVAATSVTAGPGPSDVDLDRIVLLGTKGGPAIRGLSPSPSASVLFLGGVPFVIDAGYGVTFKLVTAGISLPTLRRVFITHLHSDHTLEAAILPYNAWAIGLRDPFDVWGPRGIVEMISHGLAALRVDIDTRIVDEGRPDVRELVTARVYDEGVVTQTQGVTVRALRVPHPPLADCFALRFESGGRAVVFSGDTAFFPPLADFARDADVLVHEVAFAPALDALAARNPNAGRLAAHLRASHTMAEDVGRIAERAGVRLLVLNHFVPADDPGITAEMWRAAVATEFGGNIVVGRDGLVVPLR